MSPTKSRKFPVNMRVVQTKDDLVKQISDIIAAFNIPPGEWLFFPTNPRGDQAKIIFDDMNATELDRAAPNNPIIMSVGMPERNINMASGNAIRELWRKYGDFLETYGRYWIDAAGKPSGVLEAPASRLPWEDEEFGLGPKLTSVWRTAGKSSRRVTAISMNETMASCARWWTRPLIVFRNAGSSATASPASAVRSVARSTCWPSAARLVISARRVRPSEWRPLWSGLLVRSSKRFLTGSWCGPSLKSFGPLSDAIESFWGNSAVPHGEASASTSDMPWAVTACPRPSSPSKPTATSSTGILTCTACWRTGLGAKETRPSSPSPGSTRTFSAPLSANRSWP